MGYPSVILQIKLDEKFTYLLLLYYWLKMKKKYYMNNKVKINSYFFCQASINSILLSYGSSRSEVFLRKEVLKVCSKFTGEHPCWSVISIDETFKVFLDLDKLSWRGLLTLRMSRFIVELQSALKFRGSFLSDLKLTDIKLFH